MSVENDILEALYTMAEEMTIANGYSFDWVAFHNKDIHQEAQIYVQIEADDEENTDEDHYTSSNQYRQTTPFLFYVHLESQIGEVDVDVIRYNSKRQLKIALTDIKKKFNSLYNIAGDAGALTLQYQGREFVESESEDAFAPVKMAVTYEIKYIEERGI